MSRVLVTGGLGYIGTHVVDRLLKQGSEVVTLDIAVPEARRPLMPGELFVLGDCSDSMSALSRLDMIGPVDAIIHLAAMVEAPQSMIIPEVFYRVNSAGTLNMLELASRLGATAFIFASSAAVYGSTAEKLSEDDLTPAPENPYGGSKLFGERICYDVAKRRRLALGVLRFFNVVGAESGLVVRPPMTNLFGHIHKSANFGTKLNIYGDNHNTKDGSCVRDYVSVKSIAEGIIRTLTHLLGAASHYGSLNPLNIGTGLGTTVNEIVTIAKDYHKNLTTKLCPARDGESSISIAQVDNLSKLFNWTPPVVNIAEALKEEDDARSMFGRFAR